VLATGLALWSVYGALQADRVVIAANSAGLALLVMIISFKVREMIAARRRGGSRSKAQA
jgi:hypothetical protein